MRRTDFSRPELEAASPAMRFILAAHNAMPATMGDRDRIAAMGAVMSLAIRSRFLFDKEDGATLADRRLGIETTVGVFRPLDANYYALSCAEGGTYARTWERHKGIRPWTAPLVVLHDSDGRRDERPEHRVWPGVSLKIALPVAQDAKPYLARDGEYAVWRCAAIEADSIKLFRYAPATHGQMPRQRSPNYSQDYGARPQQTLKLDRKEWTALFLAQREEAAQAHGIDAERSEPEAARERQSAGA